MGIPTKVFEAALDNIVEHGDTDIFPFPIENRIFFDSKAGAIKLLEELDKNFDASFAKTPPVNQSALCPVGYTGFRWATQIDPLWNAYFLALVISIGKEIESARIDADKNVVFSYRFDIDPKSKRLFRDDLGWRAFQAQSLHLAKKHEYVMLCDIADFYSRIYHHRLENSLKLLHNASEATNRIMKLLQRFSNNNSYGLPIGGPAARLLSELVLNRTDKLFVQNGLQFCRFADDYHVFAASREEAYQNLVFISEKLLRNEGLSLQKAKTRILSAKEFISTSGALAEKGGDEEGESEARQFLKMSLRFDPYSETAEKDYEDLKKEVRKFDIQGMLNREIGKSRVHSAVTKKLIGAVRFLDAKIKNDVAQSLVENFDVLAPVFPSIMILLRDILDELNKKTQKIVIEAVVKLIHSKSHITQVDVNLQYALRLIAQRHSDENEELLVQLYKVSGSELIKRDVILIMAKWGVNYWISDLKNNYYQLGQWERRSFIVASYMLGDEGKHWRDHAKKEFTSMEEICKNWAASKSSGQSRLREAL